MKFTSAQWLAWLGATLVAAVTLSTAATGLFETKADSKDKRDQIIMRLDRLESKIDRIWERGR